MEVAILRARAEWRRRWASYAVLGLVGTVALTAVTGTARPLGAALPARWSRRLPVAATLRSE